ncbi:MAG: tetratricopeptide repeat protein [Bacteroidota bacterium]
MRKTLLIIMIITAAFTVSANNTYKIDSLLHLLEKNPGTEEQIKIYVDLAALYSLSEPEKAKKYSNMAFRLSKENNDPKGMTDALNNLAVTYYYQGDYEKAIEHYSHALDIDRSNNNEPDIATRLSNIGMVYCDLGNYPEAIACYEQALEIDKKLGNTKNIAVRLNNIAMIYTVRGDYESALEYFQEALEIDKSLANTQDIPIRLNNIGMIFLYLEKYQDAIDYFNQALEIDRDSGNKKNIAIRLNNLGRANSALGNHEKALTLFDQALEINREIENQGDIAIGLKNKGECFIASGKYHDAGKNLYESLQINTRLGKQSEVCMVYSLLGKLYMDMGRTDSSLKYYNESNVLGKELNMLPVLTVNFWNMAGLFRNLNMADSSLYYYQLHIQLKDSIYNETINTKLAVMQAKYIAEKNEKEIAVLTGEKILAQSKMEKQRNLIYLFILLLLVLVTGFLMIYIIQRNRNLQAKTRLREDLNLYMQKALRQQMNPHFIFNTLTSIQYFILQNDNLSSNKYLTKFAKLMRQTLDNSQYNTVALQEEIESLKLYLELESLRFETKFEFNITVESEKILDYQVPTLLIQPFVENSIWHGIMHKKETGKINVAFYSSGDNLVCEIEDNGIGRQRAAEIKASKSITYHSLGTKITRTRLELINTLFENNMSIEYTDLKNEKGEATGTKVKICIPVNI